MIFIIEINIVMSNKLQNKNIWIPRSNYHMGKLHDIWIFIFCTKNAIDNIIIVLVQINISDFPWCLWSTYKDEITSQPTPSILLPIKYFWLWEYFYDSSKLVHDNEEYRMQFHHRGNGKSLMRDFQWIWQIFSEYEVLS